MKNKERQLERSVKQSQRTTGRRGYTTNNCSNKQSELAQLRKKIKRKIRRRR
jgi:hypothetical protein